MKVLWICNIMLPVVAQQLHMPYSHKEGWLSGLAEVLLKQGKQKGIRLAAAFPVDPALVSEGGLFHGEVSAWGSTLEYYGFVENTLQAHVYDSALEGQLEKIMEAADADVIHCFGTEYPHALAAARVCPDRKKLLIGMQGVVAACADAYMANLPLSVIRSVTFRDLVKKDSIQQQQAKFAARGVSEKEAIRLAGNITGRTDFDKKYVQELNRDAAYFVMNETLRSGFYEGCWSREACEPHRIFVSQGDYPLKGMHYALKALALLKNDYPDAKICAAGNDLTAFGSVKEKLKLSAYGKYLRSLIRTNGLQDSVEFLGSLSETAMKEQYLKAECFLCCSSMENSPNSLGEAMLLGVPCVSAEVGGVSSLFQNGKDGITYAGFCKDANAKTLQERYAAEAKEEDAIAGRIAECIRTLWENPEQAAAYGQNAARTARLTHDKERNYQKLFEIYEAICLGERA